MPFQLVDDTSNVGSGGIGGYTGKHAEGDERYFAARAALSAEVGPQELWSVVDQFPLWCGTMTLARVLTLAEAVRVTHLVPGDVVEFGSYRGATLLLFAKLLRLRDPNGIKVVHGFDTWEGFDPARWAPEDRAATAAAVAGTHRGDEALIRRLADLFALDGGLETHRGPVEETWPAWLTARPGRPVSLAHLDVDLYAPTRAALDGLHDRLPPGGLILLDEYGDALWPGETRAVNEFLAAHPGAYAREAVAGARQPTLVLRKREG